MVIYRQEEQLTFWLMNVLLSSLRQLLYLSSTVVSYCHYSIIRLELEKRRLPLERYEYDSCLLHLSLDIDIILLVVPANILSFVLYVLNVIA